MRKQIEVVGAVIVHEGRILCTRRGPGNLAGMWEFPGGKLEVGESPQQALIREISEELACTIEVGEKVTTTTHEYDFAVVTLTTFFCTLRGGDPQLSEHTEARWLLPSELHALDWAPADIPAVRLIQDELDQ